MVRETISLVIAIGLSWSASIAQKTYTPYPIIFVHGLASSDLPWYGSFSSISKVYGDHIPSAGNDAGTVVHAMLNRYSSTTSLFGQDGIEGTQDDDVYVSEAPLTPGAIYTLNLQTAWNEVPSSPMILPYEEHWTYARESQSSQASIVKQGYALKRCIQMVLEANNADKVILVGHSMGGLAIREYLQRRNEQRPQWWINPSVPGGHHVAHVATIGSPHLGCDIASMVPSTAVSYLANRLIGALGVRAPDVSSEAMRDLRATYRSGSARRGLYLFGGNEQGLNTHWLLGGWYTADVDCNGLVGDSIRGLDVELKNTMPLPTDLTYTWIISSVLGLDNDMLVDVASQSLLESGVAYPLGIADTMHTSHVHWNGMSDAYAIMRGLDEPSTMGSAYDVHVGRHYRGAITTQSQNDDKDRDVYRLDLRDSSLIAGGLRLIIRDTIAVGRNLSFAVIDDIGDTIATNTCSSAKPSIVYLDSTTLAKAGRQVYLSFTGTATRSSWQYPYEFVFERGAQPRWVPRIVGLSDTTITHYDTLVDVFTLSYDDLHQLQWEVRSSDTTIIPQNGIAVVGNGTHRILRIVPRPFSAGLVDLNIRINDSNHSVTFTHRIKVTAPMGYGEATISGTPFSPDNTSGADDDAVTVMSESQHSLIQAIEVFDVMGRAVSIGQPNLQSARMPASRLETITLDAACYVVRITTSSSVTLKPLLVIQ
jgi:triacylglycerol esterase/lipase EstA (alpha/beta hydrolase family)